jgi:tetratricopeptide (TPR) repeat protein
LLAIYNAAALARATQSAQVEEYQQLLTEHLDRWPTGSHADQTRWWLGRLYEHQQRWSDALATYREVSAAFPSYENSLRAVARCWEKRLNDLASDGSETADEAEAAARWFENVILGTDGRLPEQWSPEDRFAAVEAAKLWLTYTENGFAAAKGVLDAALSGSRDAPGQWQTEAQMLLVVALAGLNRRTEAMEVVGRLSGGEASRLAAMVRALDTLRKQAPPSARRDLAKLQLEALSLAKSMDIQFSELDRNRLEIVRAEALAETGATSEARKAFQELAAAHPENGQIQAGYAQLLMESGDRESLQRALDKWREVARRSPSTSERWYQAKYSLALTHYQLGDKQRAARLIQYLQTLHPDLGGDEWRDKFQRLLARCRE